MSRTMTRFPAAVGVAAAVALLTCGGVSGNLIQVGGKEGWNSQTNYTEWASNQSFYVNDWLMFRFDRYMYDVLEVNATSYEHCNAAGFLTNITRGKGRDVFQLTQPRPYFFICSKGFCFNGMKLAINVAQAPAPAPAPPSSAAVTQDTGTLVLGVVLSFMLVFASI